MAEVEVVARSFEGRIYPCLLVRRTRLAMRSEDGGRRVEPVRIGLGEGGDEVSNLPLVERGRLLSELAATLATLPKDRPQTWRLGEAMRLILGADGVALTLEYLTDNRVTVCASDETAAALESWQEVIGQGHGYEAARNDVVVVADLDGDTDERWPMLSRTLEARVGPLRVYAVPMRGNGRLAGVATLHTGRNRSLSEHPDRVAFLASAVGASLAVDAEEHTEGYLQSGEGWSSRSVVHQATGMLMAQVRVSAEDALALLRAHAYALATDINDVAARVVGRSINFSNFDVEGD
jgi:hypothetical protein